VFLFCGFWFIFGSVWGSFCVAAFIDSAVQQTKQTKQQWQLWRHCRLAFSTFASEMFCGLSGAMRRADMGGVEGSNQPICNCSRQMPKQMPIDSAWPQKVGYKNATTGTPRRKAGNRGRKMQTVWEEMWK